MTTNYYYLYREGGGGGAGFARTTTTLSKRYSPVIPNETKCSEESYYHSLLEQ